MVMRDLEGAAANLRRAVALDSSREQAWDLLMASLLMQDGKDGEGFAVAEARVKASPTARNFVLLAKTAYDAGKMDQALAAAEKAVRVDRRSFFAQHTLGVLSVLQGRNREQLLRAGGPLAAAGKLVDAQVRPEDMVQFLVNVACYHGLVDEPSVGLKLARQALQIASNDEDVKAAVDILQRMAGTP
jgi:tetratricopeptide (TPR) repeat protein